MSAQSLGAAVLFNTGFSTFDFGFFYDCDDDELWVLLNVFWFLFSWFFSYEWPPEIMMYVVVNVMFFFFSLNF